MHPQFEPGDVRRFLAREEEDAVPDLLGGGPAGDDAFLLELVLHVFSVDARAALTQAFRPLRFWHYAWAR